jgi:hypothetical protein
MASAGERTLSVRRASMHAPNERSAGARNSAPVAIFVLIADCDWRVGNLTPTIAVIADSGTRSLGVAAAIYIEDQHDR